MLKYRIEFRDLCPILTFTSPHGDEMSQRFDSLKQLMAFSEGLLFAVISAFSITVARIIAGEDEG